ncbi:PepSY domain-containing protein [Cytophagaceae bacterium YF14B1]|uniref:PepSY domain-containing protein n=1 Tax=Xanthocytophaga flava TaxID=3048013 RepID=A0AAE3QW78_9BACT|nr:PepSY domain-containing protein [Xanthocytophaga flavus]MDJ1486156.1 PepSY domain-containing protein [Xanthocytophaga flavus]
MFHQRRQEDKTLGAKWRNSNYAIHTGSIYGLPTKLLATLAALFLASLPVTGFLIWKGRNKKTRSSENSVTLTGYTSNKYPYRKSSR